VLRIAENAKDWDGELALILAHGAGQGMDSPFMQFFHQGLAERGWLTVRFNFDYMEEGRKMPDSQSKLQARYRSVIHEVAEAYRPRRIVAGGKSMGGRVASHIAGSEPVAGLVFLGYPLHPAGRPDRMRDAHLYELDRPMLFVSGSRDNLAEQSLLEQIVGRLRPRADLHWIEGADHSLQRGRSGKETWPEALEAIDGWLRGLQSRV
jgi:predicted alpha/beta-hydrolase family hydrolase